MMDSRKILSESSSSNNVRSNDVTGRVSYEVILGFALRSLGRTRLTAKQLRDKIVMRFTKTSRGSGENESDIDGGIIIQEDIDRVIARMIEEKYIDDRELAAIFIRDTMARRPHGRLWIQQQLAKKGVDRDVVAEVLVAHQEATRHDVAGGGVDAELEAARAAAEKKLRLLSGKALEPRKQYEKMFRFLVGRGFDTSMVIRVLDEVVGKK